MGKFILKDRLKEFIFNVKYLFTMIGVILTLIFRKKKR